MHTRETSTQTAPPASFATLAKRIARRTTDLLAIGIASVGLLTVGTTLSGWWRTDPESVTDAAHLAAQSSGSLSPWGGGGEPVGIELGEQLGRLTRQVVVGDGNTARRALEQQCRRIVQRSHDSELPVTSAELSLLRQILQREPTMAAGKWRLDVLEAELPLIIGTRSTEVDGSAQWRINCWGIAFPIDDMRWSLLTLQPSAAGTDNHQNLLPLPPDSRRVLSLRGHTGETFTTFSGSGRLGDAAAFFGQSMPHHGWKAVGDWQLSNAARTRRFHRNDGRKSAIADIALIAGGNDRWCGTISMTPFATAQE